MDLSRYAGTWYEVARFPNRFQRDCVGDVTATYTLRPDSAMILSFLPNVWGDYRIIGLDPEYRWAVVGEPKRKDLWVLSRTPAMPAEASDRAMAIAKANGFDTARLQKTTHSR